MIREIIQTYGLYLLLIFTLYAIFKVSIDISKNGLKPALSRIIAFLIVFWILIKAANPIINFAFLDLQTNLGSNIAAQSLLNLANQTVDIIETSNVNPGTSGVMSFDEEVLAAYKQEQASNSATNPNVGNGEPIVENRNNLQGSNNNRNVPSNFQNNTPSYNGIQPTPRPVTQNSQHMNQTERNGYDAGFEALNNTTTTQQAAPQINQAQQSGLNALDNHNHAPSTLPEQLQQQYNEQAEQSQDYINKFLCEQTGNCGGGPMNTYTVKHGDSLYKIAKKFNTTIEALAQVNDIRRRDRIRTGQVLVIP